MRTGIAAFAIIVVAVAFACTAAVSQEAPEPAAAAEKGVSMEIHAAGEVLEAAARFPGGSIELRRSDEGLRLSVKSMSPDQAFEAIHVLMEAYQTVMKGTARPEGAGELRELHRAHAEALERMGQQARRIERLEHAVREQQEVIQDLREHYLAEQRRAVEVREERLGEDE